jgi:hypothetical protein
MKFPFTPSPQYTAIALAYQNREMIADKVLPRMTVTERSFKWDLRTKDELFTVPRTLVGRKGQPNEVEFTATEQTSSVNDYGLDDVVPYEDIESAQSKPGLDPLGRATEGTAELIALDREKRVADLVFANATYPSGSKATLSGTSQWSDAVNSDPVTAIMTVKEGALIDFNTLVIGSQVWLQLRKHPKIIAAAFAMGGNASVGGYASLAAVADLFEVQRVLIGRSWINTAKPGQTSTLGRIWGKHAALLRITPLAGLRGNGISFGATAQYGTRIAGTIPEPKIGLRGAERVRVGETLKELITAPDAGYFFENAVA